MNLNTLQVSELFKKEIINHTEFNTIYLPTSMEGNTGYITFFDDSTMVVNIENDKYYKGNQKITLPTYYDINILYFSHLFSSDQAPIFGNILKKSLSRVAHNLCIFYNKERTKYMGIGGRFDEKQPDRWKPFGITEDKGLYLLSKEMLDGGVWIFENNKKPIIGKDTSSKFRKPASYDSQLSCIYSYILQKYVLITRNNVGKEQRFFSLLYSDDCLKWSEFHTPVLKPDYEASSGDQYYSILMHELIAFKIILGVALFYNEKSRNYGIKLLVTRDTKTWRDAGILFLVPTEKMPRNQYIRPKIHCGGITSNSEEGKITFYFYKYKERNLISFFKKTYKFVDLFTVN